MFIFAIARSNQGLINAFEHWSRELRLVQGASLKILGSEAEENKSKEINYSSLNRSQCIFFFWLHNAQPCIQGCNGYLYYRAQNCD